MLPEAVNNVNNAKYIDIGTYTYNKRNSRPIVRNSKKQKHVILLIFLLYPTVCHIHMGEAKDSFVTQDRNDHF